VDIDQQVTEVVEQMQKTIDTHHIKITGASNVQKKIDKERLFQVISNLITNAVKYSPNQEKIEVYLEKFDDHVQIRVKDFGQGMEEKEAEHVFEPFYRAPSAQAQSDDGLGMGLFLSKQIVNYYHGKIWFVTEPGSGSTFFVNLPICS
jgi:two-component system CheB/CheR fusion protein